MPTNWTTLPTIWRKNKPIMLRRICSSFETKLVCTRAKSPWKDLRNWATHWSVNSQVLRIHPLVTFFLLPNSKKYLGRKGFGSNGKIIDQTNKQTTMLKTSQSLFIWKWSKILKKFIRIVWSSKETLLRGGCFFFCHKTSVPLKQSRSYTLTLFHDSQRNIGR